jgi:DNA (cytosine-5)-methyltransferase 1
MSAIHAGGSVRSSRPRQPSRRPGGTELKAIDFFCGAGGLTRGLLDAGIAVLAGIDNDDRLRRTYESNNKPSRFICKDIAEIDIVELRKSLGIVKSDIVVYAACTPCQPFSTLNQRRGVDDRKELLLTFGEIVKRRPPDYIVVENVPGLKNAYGREIYRKFLAMLSEVGFIHTDGDLLDAQDYGVPQERKRFLMLASRRGPIALPQASRRPPRTVRSAIHRFAAPIIGLDRPRSSSAQSATPATAKKQRIHPNHVARELGADHLKIIQAIPHDGGSRSDVLDESVLLKCHRGKSKIHRDVFGRMSWDAPAPTLTCRATDIYCGRFGHPEQDRGLSLREAAALQTFRWDYVFRGTFYHAAQQIGNAVPVRLARRLGRAILASHSQFASA